MDRYIDADKANDFIKRSDAIDTMRRFNGYFDDDTITRFEIALTNYIQAADVVEVVRCKDCKHNHCELVAGEECWLCGLGHEGYKIDRQDFYCADGERREA